MSTSAIVIILLMFVDGLLIGFAAKRAAAAFVAVIVAVVISAYLGIAFINDIPYQSIYNWIYAHSTVLVNSVESLAPIGYIGSFSLLVVIFVVGLAIGFLKG